MQKTQNVIDPAAAGDAALSHTSPQQAENFLARELDAFNQAHDHPHVRQHRRTRQAGLLQHHSFQAKLDRRRRFRRTALGGGRRRRLKIRRCRRRSLMALAAGIEKFLLTLPLGRAIVCGAALVGTLSSVVLPATEGTSQLPPARVAGMRQKANPAVDAVNDALLKMGTGSQNRVQRRLILPDKRFGAIVPVPIRAKRETFLDGDGKKAKFAVILVILFTSSSYLIEANASRGRARFFLRSQQKSAPTVRTTDSRRLVPPDHFSRRDSADPPHATS